MSIRLHVNTDPQQLGDLKELLAKRVAIIEGETVVCPFCLFDHPPLRRRVGGPRVCQQCGRTFYVALLGKKTFLTSKRAIDDDFLQS